VIEPLRTAIGFLTRLPVGGATLDAAALSRAAVWFPVVGALVGGVAAVVRAGTGEVLPAAPATVLAMLAAAAVTGGLHEDGLADVADGFGAHVGRERRLEIMRDPRTGAYGGLAIVFAVLLAFSLLAPLDTAQFAEAVLCAHVLGRCAAVVQARLLPAARADGLGALFAPAAPATIVATMIAGGFVVAVVGVQAGAAAIAGAAVAGAALGALALQCIGGATGDVHGAVVKVVELAVYVALVASWT